MTAGAPTPTGEKVAQVLTGVVIGAAAVYTGLLLARGPVTALVVMLVGAAFLARNRPRVRWVARGVLASGLLTLTAILIVLATAHDIL